MANPRPPTEREQKETQHGKTPDTYRLAQSATEAASASAAKEAVAPPRLRNPAFFLSRVGIPQKFSSQTCTRE
jgi:hypothetical protein